MSTAIFKIHPNDTSRTACKSLKADLITWAQNQATGYRVQASIGLTAKHYDRCTTKADSFEFMAKYLEGMEIVETTPTPKPVKMCPDTNRACEENCGTPDCHLKLSKAGLFDVD